MPSGAAVLATANTNPVVAAHVGSEIYQSAKSTAKNVATVASGAAKIVTQNFTASASMARKMTMKSKERVMNRTMA